MSLYQRLRTAAARFFSTTPAAIEAQGREGSLLLSDVLQVVHLAAADPMQGPGVVEFVWPGALDRAERKRKEAAAKTANMGTMRLMVNIIKAKNPTDERTLNWIAAAEEELKRHGA